MVFDSKQEGTFSENVYDSDLCTHHLENIITSCGHG